MIFEDNFKTACEVCAKQCECSAQDPRDSIFKCPECGVFDSCSPKRGGLCLACYAKNWNEEHPFIKNISRGLLLGLQRIKMDSSGWRAGNHSTRY